MRCWVQCISKLWGWFTRADRRSTPTNGLPAMIRCQDMVDLIVDYLEDTLEPDVRQAFEAHIADCQNCWRFLKTYRETIALGQQLRADTIPLDVRERLETFLRSRLPQPHRDRS
jgi:anti-sigma factor RsiW